MEPVIYDLDCSLAELFNGCIKKFTITRKRFNGENQLCEESKQLVIRVKPGWKKGTKITFPSEGDEGVGVIPADVIFTIRERENSDPGYSREGYNLIYTYRLSLSDALTDCSLQIPTLDQRVISLACPEVVSPYYEKLIPGMIITYEYTILTIPPSLYIVLYNHSC
jgi:DnaJ-class molecular chaperone